MKLYRIYVDNEHPGAHEIKPQWLGTQGDCSKLRRELTSQHGVPRKYVVTREVDVPTHKSGLLEFLNNLEQGDNVGLAQGSDQGAEE